jgi:hypothetical protein
VDPVPYEPLDKEEDVAPGGADPLVSNPAKELESARSDNKRLKTELSVMRKRFRGASKILVTLRKDPNVKFPAAVDPVDWELISVSSSKNTSKSPARDSGAVAAESAAKDPA